MQKDYSVTIFSRNKGTTRTFNLDRRIALLPCVLAVVLLLGCFLFARAYFQERKERQLLQGRITMLEQLTNTSEERLARQGGDPVSEIIPEPVDKPSVNLTNSSVQEEVETETQAVSSEMSSQNSAELEREAVVEIDEARAGSLEQNQEGFKLTFKLANVAGELVEGHVAIIASLRPPHKPRYVSFPSMRLVDGLPVKLRKTVGFSIRYFKYISGRFFFPFSYSESFRILVYNQDENLILDSTILADDIEVGAFSTEQVASSDSAPVGGSLATGTAATDNEYPTTESTGQNSQ
jgi:hypothetical protein